MKTRISILTAVSLLFCLTSASAQHTVQKLWETDTVLATPESVLPDGKVLYVSLINGHHSTKDGIGGVGKVSTEGKIIDTAWITGLNAPKGMGKYGNLLFVADLDEVVIINIKEGTINKKVKVDGAGGLNDITVDKKGAVYITDAKYGTVYKMVNGKAVLYLENLKGINGILSVDKDLYVLTDGVYKIDENKKATKLTTLEQGGDGVEPIGNGDLLITSWGGYLYYVSANGTKQVLLDTHAANIQTADIGYDAKNRIIYVPTFFHKSIAAYKLSE
ncbi:MAG: ATP-binding protein [Sphingobacteriales bacterium]|nr:MAG: ATP-binding protein [Sphingobacteriales bacterium]